MIKVIHGGLWSTVQDANGRPGYYSLGIPPSGASDSFALRVGNLLVKNDQNAAGIEVILFGLKLEMMEDTVIAVTGGDLGPKINDSELPMWQAVHVKRGDLISFGQVETGATAYLAVAGGIDVPLVLGSASTYVRGRLGGHKGRKLQAGDTLNTSASKADLSTIEGRKVRPDLIPKYGEEWQLRIVFGVTDYVYTDEAKQLFLNSDWKVSHESDRVGYRFIGPKLNFIDRKPPFGAGTDPSNVVDTPYPIGSIHCPAGVVPILLHKDGVSGGGYATIGTVISVDLDKVAQFKAGDIVRFKRVTVEEAVEVKLQREQLLKDESNVIQSY
ncbi:MAG: biotin-dependent carboxyltransferase family protein [Candidatus Bathyarchaeia archaeon]